MSVIDQINNIDLWRSSDPVEDKVDVSTFEERNTVDERYYEPQVPVRSKSTWEPTGE